MKGIKADRKELTVGRKTEVECDYVRWRKEKLMSITWSVGYTGVKTDILTYTTSGSRVTPSSTFIVPDLESANEKKVELSVLEDSNPEDEVKVCCEVTVLVDDGYGGMKPLSNERCEQFDIVKSVEEPVELDMFSSHRDAEVGDTIEVECRTRQHHHPAPNLVILLNGQQAWSEKMRGNNGVKSRVDLKQHHFNSVRRSIGWGGYKSKVILYLDVFVLLNS